ncbi:CHAT domain-containing protein [Spirosoma taeanense]|uniref:CHAT domain-containing protein n=1 Tax=Spirosoma taeanense TaxID=2735870 RepID=A0A6M5Y8G8_9BACT|nr:CHAT domain-containing protein [Spirosoma taeanense]QJW89550.1 CHAT domain-containing protein [Spirosoma taeanense]
MSRFLFCSISIASALVAGLSTNGLAQRPSAKQLSAFLQRVSNLPAVEAQIKSLNSWQQQWRKCGYPPDSTYINGLLQLGLAYLYAESLPQAIHVTQQAVQLSQAHRSDITPDQPAKAFYRLGMLLSEYSQLYQAARVLKQAVRLGQNIPSGVKWASNAYLYLAYVYYSAGDYQQSVQNAERGQELARNIGDTALVAKLLQDKAKALNVLKKYDEAQRAAEQAVALARQRNYSAILAYGYKQLGFIAESQGKLDKALQYRQRAFEIAEKIKDHSTPDYAVSLGLTYYQLKRYEQASLYFQYGVDSSRNLYAKARALNSLGNVCWKKKEFPKALRYYQQGLTTIPINFQNPAVESLPGAQTIRLADQKDYLLTLIQDKADTWLDYAIANKNKPNYLTHALETYMVADQMIDFMRWEHTGQQSKLYWRDKTRAMYERAIETCYRLGNAEQAFRFLEKSRAVMLADKLNELGARQLLAPKQLAQEQALNQRVADRQARLASISPDSAAYSKAHAELLLEQDRLDTFRKTLEASNPDYYRYKYDSTTTALSDVRKYLKKQGGSLVTYFVGDSALYILNVTADRATLHRKPVDPYNRIAYAFMPLLSSPDNMNRQFGKFLTLSHGLYQQLLAPLKLPAGRVIVSPDGFFLPFEALSRSAQQPDYAVKDYAFSYAYSAGLLLKNRTHSPSLSPVGDFLGVAPVQFSPAMNQLALINSDNFLETIAGRFRQARLLTHENATRRAFQTDVAGYRVVHLFTHAIADSTEREPLLYFADSTLRLSELGDNGLPNAQLVVLAACKTGIGANQRGEGVFSLGRGFAALGVPSVMTTLWSVQNEATYRLTELFYKYLYEGEPKDIALQRAKQDWLKTAEGADQLPNFWAGLILVGNAEPLHQPNRWPWLAGLGLAIVIGLAGWRTWQNRRPKQTTQRAYQSS